MLPALRPLEIQSRFSGKEIPYLGAQSQDFDRRPEIHAAPKLQRALVRPFFESIGRSSTQGSAFSKTGIAATCAGPW